MSVCLSTPDFLTAPGVMLDVRSPAEYVQGHIPEAVSFPLFDNAERVRVGTCYKQQGREAAIELGLEIVGPKLAGFVQQAKVLTGDRVLRIHCWRGGMRSGSMAWLLETAGFQVSLLDRGYKGFRQWIHANLAIPKPILILGGMTGTGKTAILHALAALGEPTLDLEHCASHRGSSYGNLGLPPPPTIEQFENLIGLAWSRLDGDRPIWIEAESRMVGTCRIPDALFNQMVQSPVLQVERSRPQRIELLLQDYGGMDPQQLIVATERLQKRLGRERVQAAVACIRRNDLAAAISMVLDYYDKTYVFDLHRRGGAIYSVDVADCDAAIAARRLLATAIQMNLARSESPLLPSPDSCGMRL